MAKIDTSGGNLMGWKWGFTTTELVGIVTVLFSVFQFWVMAHDTARDLERVEGAMRRMDAEQQEQIDNLEVLFHELECK